MNIMYRVYTESLLSSCVGKDQENKELNWESPANPNPHLLFKYINSSHDISIKFPLYRKIVSNSLWFHFYLFHSPELCKQQKKNIQWKIQKQIANAEMKVESSLYFRNITPTIYHFLLILFSCELIALLFENKQHLHSQLQPICICAKVCKYTDSRIMYSRICAWIYSIYT